MEKKEKKDYTNKIMDKRDMLLQKCFSYNLSLDNILHVKNDH